MITVEKANKRYDDLYAEHDDCMPWEWNRLEACKLDVEELIDDLEEAIGKTNDEELKEVLKWTELLLEDIELDLESEKDHERKFGSTIFDEDKIEILKENGFTDYTADDFKEWIQDDLNYFGMELVNLDIKCENNTLKIIPTYKTKKPIYWDDWDDEEEPSEEFIEDIILNWLWENNAMTCVEINDKQYVEGGLYHYYPKSSRFEHGWNIIDSKLKPEYDDYYNISTVYYTCTVSTIIEIPIIEAKVYDSDLPETIEIAYNSLHLKDEKEIEDSEPTETPNIDKTILELLEQLKEENEELDIDNDLDQGKLIKKAQKESNEILEKQIESLEK